jgi:hypothetical protein
MGASSPVGAEVADVGVSGGISVQPAKIIRSSRYPIRRIVKQKVDEIFKEFGETRLTWTIYGSEPPVFP